MNIDKVKSIAGRVVRRKQTWATVSAVGLAGAYLADGKPVEAFRSLLAFFGI